MTDREKETPNQIKPFNRIEGDPLKDLIGNQPLAEALREAQKNKDLSRLRAIQQALDGAQKV